MTRFPSILPRVLSHFLLFVFLCMWAVNASAQVKFEKESRLPVDEVPDAALAFIADAGVPTDIKIKWYYEEGFEGNSVEAKYKAGGARYSVEFDTDGKLQDIEIEIAETAIPEAASTAIRARLQSEFSRHKIIKIQIQYSGDESAAGEFLENGENQNALTRRYEIVVKGKKDGQYAWFEFTFSADGEYEQQSRIIFENTDNLEF